MKGKKPGRPAQPKPVCGKCNGAGTVKEWTVDRNGKRISYDKTCDRCGGTGYAW